MEDVLSGFLFDRTVFCSSENLDQFNNNSCPYECIFANNVFWNAASLNFAKKASGFVTVVLNGTRSFGAVSNQSTFVKYELPAFDSRSINLVNVFLLHQPGAVKYETCSNPKTLVYLMNELNKKNITYKCVEDPKNIIGFFCFQNAFSKECKSIKFLFNKTCKNKSNIYLITFFMFLLRFKIENKIL